MKKNQLPIEIDPIDLAKKKASLSGRIKLGSFQRLKSVVKNSDLEALFELHFQRDEQGVPSIIGKISVRVDLTCERCGEILHLDLELKPHLGIVLTENQVRDLPEEYDPVVTNGLPISLASLVEDEILLAIPMIPKHEFGTCSID